MTEPRGQKPKIIVNEDWKTKVQAERESLQQPSDETETSADRPEADVELPPASFSLLVTTLAAQAIASMGQAADGGEKQPIVRLDVARHYIDTLDLLEQKTKGNLTPEEASLLGNVLHELRMAFLASHKPAPGPQSGPQSAGPQASPQ